MVHPATRIPQMITVTVENFDNLSKRKKRFVDFFDEEKREETSKSLIRSKRQTALGPTLPDGCFYGEIDFIYFTFKTSLPVN